MADFQALIRAGRVIKGDKMQTLGDVLASGTAWNYMKEGASLTDILSVVIVPEGRAYNDGYDMAKAKADIGSLPCTAGFAVVGFFGRWSKASIRTFLRFLTKTLRKGETKKIDPKLMEKLEKEVETLCNLLASFPTSSHSAA